jgi:hypothetical protein
MRVNVARDLTAKLTRSRDTIYLSHQTIIKEERNRLEYTKMIDLHKRRESTAKKELEKTDWKSIYPQLMEKYTKIEFLNGAIEGLTKPIILNFDGYNYNFGSFTIVIDYINGVKYRGGKPLTGQLELIHPHISAEIPCLGSIKETVPQMIVAGDYIDLLFLLHQFLESYNDQGPFQHIRRWANKFPSMIESINSKHEVTFNALGQPISVDSDPEIPDDEDDEESEEEYNERTRREEEEQEERQRVATA